MSSPSRPTLSRVVGPFPRKTLTPHQRSRYESDREIGNLAGPAGDSENGTTEDLSPPLLLMLRTRSTPQEGDRRIVSTGIMVEKSRTAQETRISRSRAIRSPPPLQGTSSRRGCMAAATNVMKPRREANASALRKAPARTVTHAVASGSRMILIMVGLVALALVSTEQQPPSRVALAAVIEPPSQRVVQRQRLRQRLQQGRNDERDHHVQRRGDEPLRLLFLGELEPFQQQPPGNPSSRQTPHPAIHSILNMQKMSSSPTSLSSTTQTGHSSTGKGTKVRSKSKGKGSSPNSKSNPSIHGKGKGSSSFSKSHPSKEGKGKGSLPSSKSKSSSFGKGKGSSPSAKSHSRKGSGPWSSSSKSKSNDTGKGKGSLSPPKHPESISASKKKAKPSGSSHLSAKSHHGGKDRTPSPKAPSPQQHPPPAQHASSPAPQAASASASTLAPTQNSIQYNVFLDKIKDRNANDALTPWTESSQGGALVERQQQQPTTGSVCTLNENGFYGTPLGTPYQVSYAYQVVVRDGTTTTMVQENVAPALDTAIAQQLLPYFFPNCTGQQRRQRRQTTSKNDWMGRELQGESGSPTVIGVSRLQSDVPISGDSCVGDAASQTCYVFDGFVSVFTENVYTQSQADELVTPALMLVFQSGVLNTVNLLIEQVQFLGEGLVSVAPIPAPSPVSSFAPASSPVERTRRPSTMTNSPVDAPTMTGSPFVPSPSVTLSPVQGSPTMAPVPTAPTTSRPIGPTIAPQPTPGGGNATNSSSNSPVLTAAPLPPSTVPPSSTPAPTSTNNNRSGSTSPTVPWWGWLLVGIGGALLLLCCYAYLGRGGEGGGGGMGVPSSAAAATKRRRGGTDDDDDDDDGGDAYVPPGGGAATANAEALGGYEPPGAMSAGNQAYEPPPDIDYTPASSAVASSAMMAPEEAPSQQAPPPPPPMEYGYEEEEEEDHGGERFVNETGDEYYEEEGVEYEDGEEEDEEYEEQEQEGSYEEQDQEGSYEETYYEEETIGREDDDQGGGWGRGGGYGGGGY